MWDIFETQDALQSVDIREFYFYEHGCPFPNEGLWKISGSVSSFLEAYGEELESRPSSGSFEKKEKSGEYPPEMWSSIVPSNKFISA